MTTTAFPLPARTQTAITRTGGWMAKRGILLVFLQMPVAALMVGYVLRLVSFPVASFAVFVSSAAFPAWVSYRISISDDPDEPVHDLHRYAANALAAVAAFTVALIPVLIAADIDLWRLWSDLGAELTGEPAAGSWSLVAGVVVYGLIATCLVTSYFAARAAPRRHRATRTTGTEKTGLIHAAGAEHRAGIDGLPAAAVEQDDTADHFAHSLANVTQSSPRLAESMISLVVRRSRPRTSVPETWGYLSPSSQRSGISSPPPFLHYHPDATQESNQRKENMKRLIAIAGLSSVAILGPLSGSTGAAPAEQAPHSGAGAHPHHVHTGNGGCREIDSVFFEPSSRGLHRGSNESGPERGPFHGTCEGQHPHLPPGGPH